MDFFCIDWAQIGIAIGSGAVAGLIGWMVPSLLPAVGTIWGSIGIGALTGSLASGGGQIAANLLSHNNWNNGLLGTMALGGITGGIAGGLGFGMRLWQANRIKAISPPSKFSELRLSMGDQPEGMQNAEVHHELPWNLREWFSGPRRGLNVNSIKFGRWVEGTHPGLHQKWTPEYGDAWNVFQQQNPNADKWQVLFYRWWLNLSGK